MGDAQVPTSEQLMAEMGWVRQLARALVKDDAVADDVAQETWVVAAEQQPETDRPLRPWLARVVINLVRTRRRSEARRDQRAIAYDSDRPVPTPAELIERVELQRALADELLALGEPYRSTVLLHFVEGYSSAEIARRLGIPNATVRRRLKTALDQLRDALARRTDQPKRGWLAALVPLSKLPVASPASAALGAFAMKKVIAIIVVLVLLLLIGAGALWRHRARKDAAASSSSASTATSGAHASGVTGDSGAQSVIPAWLVIAGAPPRRIAGRVVFHGAPVPGAKVVLGFEVAGESGPVILTPDPVSFPILQPIAEVTSAADGTFDFGVRPPLPFVVSASSTTYASAAARVDNTNPLSKSDEVVVALGDCGSRLFGTIADASGGGIAKAHISVAGLSGTDSDATGAYSVCISAIDAAGIPSTRVRVEADGYGSLVETVLVGGELRHDFQLVPEAVLVGRVVTSDGKPVDGARVVARVEPSELPRHVTSGWAYSDRDGRFRIEALAPGAFELMASAGDIGSATLAVVARPTTTSREFTLVLSRAPTARVSGHVVSKGVPVGGVEVRAVPGESTLSRADGSFVFERLGYGVTRFFVSPNYAEVAAQINIARPVVDDVRIEAPAAARIHGHVTRDGKPVAGAAVIYMPPPQATFYGESPATRTDPGGAFTLLLPVGTGQLLAWDNPGKAFASPVPIVAAAGDDKTVDIDLDRSGEVRGTVVNEAGVPVPGVNVGFDIADESGDTCEAITDAKGEFDCAMLVGGDYRPRVKPSPGSGRGFAPATGGQFSLVSVPRSGVVTGIILAIKDERLSIRGTVVDDTGSPMPDVHITAMAPGPSPMDPVSTLSDATGHFEIANLAGGSYRLRAHAADGSEAELPSVAAGTSASLTLGRAGAIEGTVSGFSAPPDVFVMKSAGPIAGRAALEGSRFSRIGLPPGRYTVVAMVGVDTDAQSVEIKPGETARVELRSRGVGTIEGTVSELATRKPLAGVRCDATISLDGRSSPGLSSPAHQAFTDAAGHFRMSAPRGRVRLFCFSPGPAPLSPAGTDVEVTSTSVANANVFSVAATFGNAPSDPGFMLTPFLLPVTVGQVVPSGPADAAGLRAGDQLVTIDGVSLQGVLPAGASILLMNHRAGTTATLGITRAGVAQTIKVVLGARP